MGVKYCLPKAGSRIATTILPFLTVMPSATLSSFITKIAGFPFDVATARSSKDTLDIKRASGAAPPVIADLRSPKAGEDFYFQRNQKG